MSISTDTIMIILLVLAGSIGTGSLGVFGLSAKKLKNIKQKLENYGLLLLLTKSIYEVLKVQQN